MQLDALEHVAREMRPLQVQLEERGPAPRLGRGRGAAERRPRLQSQVFDVQVLQSRALRGERRDVRARQKGLSPRPVKRKWQNGGICDSFNIQLLNDVHIL